MKRKLLSAVLISLPLICSPLFAATPAANDLGFDSAEIQKLTGAKVEIIDPKLQVFKVNIPRTDIKLTVNGYTFNPAWGLDSWASFMKMGPQQGMMMGDMVLLDNQVNPVMDVVLKNGLTVSALHNHFLWDNPPVMFMHISGRGSLTQLATAVGKVFAEVKATENQTSTVFPTTGTGSATAIDPAKLDAILGDMKGTYKNGAYKVVIDRTVKMDGMNMGDAMGVHSWGAFSIASNGQAVVYGDVATRSETELRNVLVALRQANIYVMAIHNHMVGDEPHYIFVHYFGVGTQEQLAMDMKHVFDQARTP